MKQRRNTLTSSWETWTSRLGRAHPITRTAVRQSHDALGFASIQRNVETTEGAPDQKRALDQRASKHLTLKETSDAKRDQ
jgi:hypothetical protein